MLSSNQNDEVVADKVLWTCPECGQPQVDLTKCDNCEFASLAQAVRVKTHATRVAERKHNKKTWGTSLAFWGVILVLVWAVADRGYTRYFGSSASTATTTPAPSSTNSPRSLTDDEYQAFMAVNDYAASQGWNIRGSTLDVTDADIADRFLIHIETSEGTGNKIVPVLVEKFNAHQDGPSYWKAYPPSPDLLQVIPVASE